MADNLNGLVINSTAVNGISFYNVLGKQAIFASAIRSVIADSGKSKVQFVSSYFDLPETGDSNTAYLVPPVEFNPAHIPNKNEIWFSTSYYRSGTATVKFTGIVSDTPIYAGITVERSKNDEVLNYLDFVLPVNDTGYFVLNLDTATIELRNQPWFDDSNLYFAVTVTHNGSDKTTILRRPTTLDDTFNVYGKIAGITTVEKLYEYFAGKIVSAIGTGNSSANFIGLINPPKIYEGISNITTVIPNDELWIDHDNWDTMYACTARRIYGANATAPQIQYEQLQKNKLGYYVLPLSILPQLINVDTGFRDIWFADANCIRNDGGDYYDPIKTQELLVYHGLDDSDIFFRIYADNSSNADFASELGGRLMKVWSIGGCLVESIFPTIPNTISGKYNCYTYSNGSYTKLSTKKYDIYNTSVKKAYALDFEGLKIFKDKLIEGYTTLSDIGLYTQAANDHMGIYRKNIVKFASSLIDLPEVGEPGVFYVMPRPIDNPQYTPKLDEIWFTTPYFDNTSTAYTRNSTASFICYKPKEYYSAEPIDDNSIITIEMPLNSAGYYVLSTKTLEATICENTWYVNGNVRFKIEFRYNCNSIDQAIEEGGTILRKSYLLVEIDMNYFSSARTFITNIKDLFTFNGKLVMVEHSAIHTIPIPQIHNGDSNTAITIPNNEVWVDPTGWEGLWAHFTDYNRNFYKKELKINKYNYYVLDCDDFYSSNTYHLWFGDNVKEADTRVAPASSSRTYSQFPNDYYYNYKYHYTEKSMTTDQDIYYIYITSSSRFNRNTIQTPSTLKSMFGGKLIKLFPGSYYCKVLPLPTFGNIDTGKYVTYMYSNGKYRRVGASLFDASEFDLASITDEELDITSSHAIMSKAVQLELNTKRNTDTLLQELVENDNERIVSSKAVYKVISKLLSRDTLDDFMQRIPSTTIHNIISAPTPVFLSECRHYRIVIRGLKSDGANYLTKIYDEESLVGLTFCRRLNTQRSLTETMEFIENYTSKKVLVTVSCSNKYSSQIAYYPADLFDKDTPGEYRCDPNKGFELTITIDGKLDNHTLGVLALRCLAGKPFQSEVSPVVKLYATSYGSFGGIDYLPLRIERTYEPSKIANDGIYEVAFFPELIEGDYEYGMAVVGDDEGGGMVVGGDDDEGGAVVGDDEGGMGTVG